MGERISPVAGGVYGRVLGYLDPPTLRGWSDASGLKLFISSWYARLFGYPELAAHRRFPAIRETLHRHGGSRVLDLGAGNGLYSLADAADRAGTFHILADVSHRHMLRAAATGQSLGLPVRGITTSAEALPLADDSVDSVLLIEVLQFLDNDETAIREIARVIRPGGAWLCEQDCPPDGTPIPRIADGRLQKRRPGYSAERLQELAARAGLALESAHPVSGRVGRRWEAWDGRLFQRSRPIHFLLFPLIRLMDRLWTPKAVPGEPGTVLYVFRKPPAGARVPA